MTTSINVLILGHGEMGQAMAYLLQDHHKIAIWEKFPCTRHDYISLEQGVPRADIVLFCLPVNPHREVAQAIAPLLQKTGLCVSIAKGLDETGKTAAQIFAEHLPANQPHALLYGPMISEEIRAGRYAFGQLGCRDPAWFGILQNCFRPTRLCIEHTADITGISWSVILKNVYAMVFGMADELELGDNVRGFLATATLQELDRIVLHQGGLPGTPYHLAGLGDLITTATSESSHHHELGRRLARGETHDISGEGPHTLAMIERHRLLDMPDYPLLHFIHLIVRDPSHVRERFLHFIAYLFEKSQGN